MQVISEKPLIFIDTDSANEISVHYRSIYHRLTTLEKKENHPYVTLNDIIKEGSAITYGIVQAGDHFEDGIPMLKVTNFLEGRAINNGPFDLVNPTLAAKYKRSKLEEGDILLSIRGTVGKVAFVPKRLEGANLNQDIAVIRLEDKEDNDFLALYLESDLARLQMTLHTRGAAVQGINLKELREVKVPVLDKEEKDCIKKRFNLIRHLETDVLSRCSSINANLYHSTGFFIDCAFTSELGIESFKETTSRNVFLAKRDTDRFDIPVNHPDYTKLVEQIKNSPASGVLSDLVEVSGERFNPDEHSGEQVNYLAIGDIDGLSGKIIAPQNMLADDLPSRARRLIREGDILVGIAGASTGTKNMVVYPVTNKQHGWVATTGFLVLRAKKDVDIHYVCTLLKSPFVLRQVRALLTSPAMPTIGESDLLAIAIPVTNTETRNKTLSTITNIISEGRQLAKKLDAIANQIQELISEAKSNIFDLLHDEKFSAMSSKANEIQKDVVQIEEALQ